MQQNLSTSLLAKSLGITRKDLFAQLQTQAFIYRDEQTWVLTDKGIEYGGTYQCSDKYGRYITWPKTLDIDMHQTNNKEIEQPVKVTNVEQKKQNWSKKMIGWFGSTKQPEKKEESKTKVTVSQEIKKKENFREKFPAKYRTQDGHFVRSKAEMIIDNWLYAAGVVHAYEKKLPIAENLYSDFYIPKGNVYIEYWGYEQESKYLERKKIKIALYKKYGFSLIQLEDKDVENIDDIMPRLLLDYDIQVY
ncbi:MAG: glycerol kinase [Mariprofundaceae bacterium]|nr:glycerol kinase [Mariprofundaceae bacterium]